MSASPQRLQAKRALFSGKSRRFEPKTLSKPLEKRRSPSVDFLPRNERFQSFTAIFPSDPYADRLGLSRKPTRPRRLGLPASEGRDGRCVGDEDIILQFLLLSSILSAFRFITIFLQFAPPTEAARTIDPVASPPSSMRFSAGAERQAHVGRTPPSTRTPRPLKRRGAAASP